MQVLRDELDCINRSRPRRKVSVIADADNLTGLAFSGGGIRSATFNLGILQGLAQKGLLHPFDYLSTVSGGGYIGSWLAALTHRLSSELNPSFDEVEKVLSPHKYEPDKLTEPYVLHWLRLYGNYLTPHKGVISGDTWAMLGTWLRNALLNQTILGLMFMSLFVLCQSALLPLVLVELVTRWRLYWGSRLRGRRRRALQAFRGGAYAFVLRKYGQRFPRDGSGSFA